MAAFSYESSNLTWQRVKIALSNANPGVVRMFKELKAHITQIKGHPDMQFFAFSDASCVAAGGTVLGTGTGSLVGAYVKKIGTGTGTATDAVVKLLDDATDDTGAGDVVAAMVLLAANDERVFVDPVGMPLAAGLVVTGHTTAVGSTDSTATDTGAGFAIIING